SGVEGLMHVSEMSWSKRVKHPSKILNVGDTVDAMVLGVDPTARRISLGLKQVETNPWHDLADKYPVGSKITGKVRNLTEFGAFVEVEDDIDGLIHMSEFDDSHHAGKDEKIDLKVGETYPMKIIKLSPAERKIGLSIRALKSDEFRADWEAYQESAGDGAATLGDHFRNR